MSKSLLAILVAIQISTQIVSESVSEIDASKMSIQSRRKVMQENFEEIKLTKQKEEITSGKLYETYTDLYKKDAVTYRRIFDFINELEMLGIISTNTISRGRGKGRTNIIKLQCDETLLESSLTVI